MLLRIIYFSLLFLLLNCGDKDSKLFKISEDLPKTQIDYTNITQAFYNESITNNDLRQKFPDFFGSVNDSLLDKRFTDSLGLLLHQKVIDKFGTGEFLKDSLQGIFQRLQYFYPDLSSPKVYNFTGELPYSYPTLYVPQQNTIIIGLDWFLGSNFEFYTTTGIPSYWRRSMTPAYIKPKTVDAIAQQLVPYDIRKSKFVERMIYEGKKLIFQDALLPQVSDSLKIGYTTQEMEWLTNNEPNVYVSFTEQEFFFSDDKKLKERFIDPAPFSKFYSEYDTETPGRLGAWMGWQICRSYLRKHPETSLKDFIETQDLLTIFKESGYKPEFD